MDIDRECETCHRRPRPDSTNQPMVTSIYGTFRELCHYDFSGAATLSSAGGETHNILCCGRCMAQRIVNKVAETWEGALPTFYEFFAGGGMVRAGLERADRKSVV